MSRLCFAIPDLIDRTGRVVSHVVTRILTLALLLAASPAIAAQCEPGTITGQVTHVRDGDTIEVDGLPIRLQGLAAPERGEPGGAEATAAMERLVLGRAVRCDLTGERTHDRCVATCGVTFDVGAAMVARGLARDCPAYSDGRYAGHERLAAERGATIGKTYQLPGYCAGKRGLGSGNRMHRKRIARSKRTWALAARASTMCPAGSSTSARR